MNEALAVQTSELMARTFIASCTGPAIPIALGLLQAPHHGRRVEAVLRASVADALAKHNGAGIVQSAQQTAFSSQLVARAVADPDDAAIPYVMRAAARQAHDWFASVPVWAFESV
jgi:hypothetical protein